MSEFRNRICIVQKGDSTILGGDTTILGGDTTILGRGYIRKICFLDWRTTTEREADRYKGKLKHMAADEVSKSEC